MHEHARQEDATLLRSKALKGRKLVGIDGEVGKLVDVLLDDARWTVRYFVVETGSWFSSRQVLISPAALSTDQPDDANLKTRLTREQITNSPPVDTQLPVSRQYEIAYAAYYDYPMYWSGGGLWGGGALPFGPEWTLRPRELDADRREKAEQQRADQDSHLRSCGEVTGYDIQAADGALGHLDEFLIDPRSWQIMRLEIDTRNWLPGKHVRVETGRISEVDWPERKVNVELTRAQIKALPAVAA